MATRNWWISGDIDGRKTEMAGGPQAKDGGFTLTIFQRVSGSSVLAVKIEGRANSQGGLTLGMYVPQADGTSGYISILDSER